MNQMPHMLTRRVLLQRAGALGLLAAINRFTPTVAWGSVPEARNPRPEAGLVDLTISEMPLKINGRTGTAIGVNGSVPGPLIRLREGTEAVIRVTNRLKESTAIHWHGVLVPPDMDGVPGVSFAGIPPGEVFTYRFPVRQSGSYWAHSHAGAQELLGLYMPLIIDPAEPEPFQYERDHNIMLSDWSFDAPATIMGNLKKQSSYYNFQRRTIKDFFADVSKNGLAATVHERQIWANMRMDPTDIADVTGVTYAYLMNGLPSNANWTALFQAGERVRLRFADAGAMTYFDVRIPGLKMTLVQADGQNVEPVVVDEFRIGPGETYDVIVEPEADRAYTIFAETMDRSGHACGTLAPRQGMSASIPERRMRPILTMSDMGMEMSGMVMNPTGAAAPKSVGMAGMAGTAGMAVAPEGMAGTPPKGGAEAIPGSIPVPHGQDTHGVGNSVVPMFTRSRLQEPGLGLGNDGRRVLVYTDLASLTPGYDTREPGREIEMHITGNMERYSWSFDGKKYSEAKTPIPFRYGERLRLTLVNDTMMAHPIHLHGMWMELENGAGARKPRKHTINVKPAERLSVAITADAPGQWAMHCHLLLHMEMGMFRVIEVSEPVTGAKL